jgi:hypothetical protein
MSVCLLQLHAGPTGQRLSSTWSPCRASQPRGASQSFTLSPPVMVRSCPLPPSRQLRWPKLLAKTAVRRSSEHAGSRAEGRSPVAPFPSRHCRRRRPSLELRCVSHLQASQSSHCRCAIADRIIPSSELNAVQRHCRCEARATHARPSTEVELRRAVPSSSQVQPHSR